MSNIASLMRRAGLRRAIKERVRRYKHRNRVQLIQTLERRDHPGSMMDVSALSLLGKAEGASDDPVSSMMKSADFNRARLQQLSKARPSVGRESLSPSREGSTFQEQTAQTPRFRQFNESSRRAAPGYQPQNRLLDLLERISTRPKANPLLDSVSQDTLGVGLDENTAPEANAGTSQSIVQPSAPSIAGIGATGADGLSGVSPPIQPADRSDTAMGSSQARGAASPGGSPSDSEGSAETDASSDPTPVDPAVAPSDGATASSSDSSTDSAATNGDADHSLTDPSQPNGDPVVAPDEQFSADPFIERASINEILTRSPGTDGLAVTAAATTSNREEGRFVLVGELGADFDAGPHHRCLCVARWRRTVARFIDDGCRFGDRTSRRDWQALSA